MKDFIKTVVAVFFGLILFSVFGAGVAVLIVFGVGSKLEKNAPKVADKGVLVYDLSLYVSDRPPQDRTLVSLNEPPAVSLHTLLHTIEAAAQDDQITALYLDGQTGYVGADFSSLKEIHQALQKFKATGKPIIAYGVHWDEDSYYLASVANTIAMDPIGSLSLDGLRAETRFYGGALEKYGVGMQVVRVGKYKSAVEPYTQKQFSAPNRQQLQSLLGDLWSEVLTSVANDRHTTVDKLQALSRSQGMLSPEVAQNFGLIDKVQYQDEVINTLAGLAEPKGKDSSGKAKVLAIPGTSSLASHTPEPTSAAELKVKSPHEPKPEFPSVEILDYSHHLPEKTEGEDEIAIVYAEGTIVSGEPDSDVVSSDEYVPLLAQLRNEDQVKAVVLRINSPGGSATASHLIEREVELLQKVKPVIVSMGSVAASGGYMIAAPAQTIVAEPNTITGSIGVFSLFPNVQKLGNDHGVSWDSVTTGPYANLYTIARPRTPSEIALLQKFVNEIYGDFLGVVAKGRKLPVSQVNQIAQGRVWSGVAAQRIKLVDELGGLNTAIEKAAAAAKLQPGQWHLAEYPYTPSLQEQIIDHVFGNVQGSLLPSAFIPQKKGLAPSVTTLAKNIESDWSTLMEFSDPQQIYMRLPYRLDIR